MAKRPDQFVEQTVKRELLHETIRDVRARNIGQDSAEIERLVDEELTAMNSSFWAAQRR